MVPRDEAKRYRYFVYGTTAALNLVRDEDWRLIVSTLDADEAQKANKAERRSGKWTAVKVSKRVLTAGVPVAMARARWGGKRAPSATGGGA